MKSKLLAFLSFFFTAAFIFFITPRITQAQTGCCGILSPSRPEPFFQTTTAEQCKTLNLSYAGGNYPFEAGKQASSDGKRCVQEMATQAIEKPKPIVPELSVSIPGFGKFSDVKCDDQTVSCQIPWIAEYIKAIYNYGLLIIGVLSVIVMMIGGVMRITAAGNKQQISHANSFISGSILGATIAICSYMILFLANPNLVIWSPVNISYIDREDLDHILEPIPFETFDEIVNSPQNTGKMEPDESKWVTVPHDKSGLGIWLKHGNGSERSSPGSVDALKKAAQCWKAKGNTNSIRISDASRTVAEQKSLYQQNCSGGKCNPPTCNPYNGRCPHTSGAAFDAWACVGSDCTGKNQQLELQDCFLKAGFCILSSECWHFEYPPVSSGCGQTKHYTGKYCN